jgi:hypothetical protein
MIYYILTADSVSNQSNTITNKPVFMITSHIILRFKDIYLLPMRATSAYHLKIVDFNI